jgi:hypothetical protein
MAAAKPARRATTSRRDFDRKQYSIRAHPGSSCQSQHGDRLKNKPPATVAFASSFHAADVTQTVTSFLPCLLGCGLMRAAHERSKEEKRFRPERIAD